jgi:hypothetical protein
MLRNDLKAAGIAPDAYCFHSLRHSYVTAIIQCGGSIKDSMELARHHDAGLTFGRYAHIRLADLSQVVNRLPALWEDSSHTLPTSGVSTGLGGTTLDHQEPCPERSQVDPLGHDYQFRPPVACSDGLPLVGIMLGRNVDDPDLLEVVERTVEPFVPEEHAATAPVDAATQVNHQPFRREGREQTPATNQDTDQREENQEQDRIHIRGAARDSQVIGLPAKSAPKPKRIMPPVRSSPVFLNTIRRSSCQMNVATAISQRHRLRL